MIRLATDTDAAGILAIWNPLIRDTLVTFNATEKTKADLCAMIAERTKAGHCFLVAEEAHQILGFASYAQFRGGIGYRLTMEHTIILGPTARGRGIGRALMTAIEAHARNARVHSMIAGVSGGNPEGRAFHAAMGYREIAILPEVGSKFGKLFDLVLMQKILS